MGLQRVNICALFLTAGTLLAQHNFTPAEVEVGSRLYRANCAVCHGASGDSISGVDLGHGKFRRASSDDDLIEIIKNGIQGTGMPPTSFNDFEAGTVVAYLRSLTAAIANSSVKGGDAARGKVLFEAKGGCTGCHRIRGTGSRAGPDLSEIGTLRTAAELEISLVDPDAEVLPQNRYFRVVTKTGAAVTGRLLNEDTFSLQILDSKEHLVSFAKSDLREYAFVAESPMPSFRNRLSDQERADVLAYLVSLKGVDIP